MKNKKKMAKSFFKNLTNGADGSPADVIKEVVIFAKQFAKAVSRGINSMLISREKKQNDDEENDNI